MIWGSNGFVGLTQGGDFINDARIESERRLIDRRDGYQAYWTLLNMEDPSLPYPDPHTVDRLRNFYNPLKDLIRYDIWLQRKTSLSQSDGSRQTTDCARTPFTWTEQWFTWTGPHGGKRQSKKRGRPEDEEEIARLKGLIGDQQSSLDYQKEEIADLRMNLSEMQRERQSILEQLTRQGNHCTNVNTELKQSRVQFDQQLSTIKDLSTTLKNATANPTCHTSPTLKSQQHDCQYLQRKINAYDQNFAALSAKYSEHNKRLEKLPKTAKLNLWGRFGIPFELSFAQDTSEQGDLSPVEPGVDRDAESRDGTIFEEDASSLVAISAT
ncbi:MAG: hypothetical protein Q9198_005524 [Flavoplaca austrocitrina]